MKKLSCLLTVAALAVVLGGCGTGSDPVSPNAVLDSAPPQAPTGLAQDLNSSNIRVLEWSANSEPDLAGYQIYQYSPDPTRDNAYVLVATLSAGTTEWPLPVVDVAEITWIRLRALDQSGNRSAQSIAAQVMLLPDGPGHDATPDEPNPVRP
ncbi:MAG: hypothetical protein ABIS67_12410 [Candidatus Eisenbacteria bacterium]